MISCWATVAPNLPPMAVDDLATIVQNSGANSIDVLVNDTDPEPTDTLTITAVTQGEKGSVQIMDGGSRVEYAPFARTEGQDTFTYTISDGFGGFDTATVTITISSAALLPPDTPPRTCYICNVINGLVQIARSLVSPGSASPESPNPVRFFDGIVTIEAADLSSDGFGAGWGQARGWSNDPSYSTGSANGSDMTNPYMIYLRQADGDDTIVLISGGSEARYFDLTGGNYVPHFFLQETLTHETGPGTFTVADSAGNRIVFFDFGTGIPAAQRGQLKEFIDPNGEVTSLTYDINGFVVETQRSRVVAGETITESYLTSYVTSGVNKGMEESVVLREEKGDGHLYFSGLLIFLAGCPCQLTFH